jgi:hypothetical protein
MGPEWRVQEGGVSYDSNVVHNQISLRILQQVINHREGWKAVALVRINAG